jgi:hypothetical protein
MLAPVAGDYAIDAGINYYNAAVTDWIRIAINVGGARYEKMGTYIVSATTWWPITQTFPRISVNNGDVIKLEGYHQNSGNISIYDGDYSTFLRVSLIDDGIGESPTTNPSPDTNILLRVSYTQTVDLVVFWCRIGGMEIKKPGRPKIVKATTTSSLPTAPSGGGIPVPSIVAPESDSTG